MAQLCSGAGVGAGAGLGAAAGLDAAAGLGAGAGFDAAGLGAAFFFAGAFLALAFLADFFGAAAFFADFLADFFADFFADFLAFFADFFEDFLADFFFAVRSFLLFLAFLPFFFLPLAIVILLLPPINVYRAFQIVRLQAFDLKSSPQKSRRLEDGANRLVQSWPGTARRPIEKLNCVNHGN